MGRSRLTNGQKVKIIADFETRFANGESKRKIAASHGIQPKQLRDWVKKKTKLASALTKKKSISRGGKSRLKPFEDEIMGWAFDQRDRGNPVSYGLICIKAGQVIKCKEIDDCLTFIRHFRLLLPHYRDNHIAH